MNPEIDRLALELFERSLDVPVAERERFLRSAAGDSAELLDLLLRMLRAPTPDEQLERSSKGMSLVDLLKLEGKQLGDFRLLKEIGGGAVGRVFIAEQVSLRRQVAVKVLRLEYSENEELLLRFRNEPEYQGALQHPNIVKVLSTGCADGWHFFAMEYIEGTSLAQMLEDSGSGKRSTEKAIVDLDSRHECARLVETVARALHVAHEKGIVHRDVKPHNILIDKRGEPYVSDFGLARSIDRSTLTGSLGDGLRGTLAYMSPEQATEFHAVDARSDVYSLGVVLYQLLTRCLPFEAETGVEMLGKILSPDSHARPPHHFLPNFEHSLSGICTTAVEKNPERRFRSALEMAEKLRAFREGRRVDLRAISRLEQIGNRRIERRTLLKASALALPLCAGAVLVGKRLRHPPSVEAAEPAVLELPPGLEPATVVLFPILSPESRLGPPQTMGVVRAGESLRLDVDHGLYRVVLQRRAQDPLELARTIEHTGSAITFRVGPSASSPPGDDMVRVERQSVRVDLPEHDVVEYECPAFWLQRSLVTNREFLEFLEATGQWPWTGDPEWTALWNGTSSRPRPANWDDLPVVSVSWDQAREYAEWRGMRLPTLAEWWAAHGFAATPRPSAEFWAALEERFALGRPRSRPWSNGGSTTAGAYLAYAQAARLAENEAYGPYRLWHPFGNVGQWLESCYFMRSGEAWRPSGMRYIAQVSWHFEPTRDDALTDSIIGVSPEVDPSADLGFRCARTATD